MSSPFTSCGHLISWAPRTVQTECRATSHQAWEIKQQFGHDVQSRRLALLPHRSLLNLAGHEMICLVREPGGHTKIHFGTIVEGSWLVGWGGGGGGGRSARGSSGLSRYLELI